MDVPEGDLRDGMIDLKAELPCRPAMMTFGLSPGVAKTSPAAALAARGLRPKSVCDPVSVAVTGLPNI